MLAYTYVEKGRFELCEKPRPQLIDPRDAIVRVTLGSICTSDLHIKHGSVPRAVPGITVGHEIIDIRIGLGYYVALSRQPGSGECRDLLRGVLLLPSWICKQLYRPSWRVGVGLSHRWRTGRVCAGTLCRLRIDPYPRWGERRAGAFRG